MNNHEHKPKIGRPRSNIGNCLVCELPSYVKGYCSKHYSRFMKYGDPLKPNVREYHGMQKSPEYKVWQAMKWRCLNPNNAGYKNYGGRGITVCDRWKDSFLAFYEDMGPRPSNNLTLERKDVNGNYEPSNCTWATWTEQMRNRRVRHDNITGFTGVTWSKRYKKWDAHIKVNFCNYDLGFYKNFNDAVKARKEAEDKYYGET